MKKLILPLFATLTICASAQTDPNRMLVNHADGSVQSVMTDRVESIEFATVDGPVTATPTAGELNMEKHTLMLDVQGTPDCTKWKYAILPRITASNLSDAKLAALVDATCQYELRSFGEGLVDTPELDQGAEYAVAVVAIDRYNTLCDVAVDYFDTPRNVIGQPGVTVKFDNITENSVEVTITPNADAPQFVYTMMKAGDLNKSFEEYGTAFGCTSIEDYLRNFLTWETHNAPVTKTFDGLVAATTYEVSVVPIDEQANLAALQTFTVTTKGGVEGQAWVEVKESRYVLMPVPNPENIYETIYMPHMEFAFTPNDATVKWRAEAFSEEEFDKMGREAAEAKVRTEPAADVPDDMWFRYTARTQLYQFNPGTPGYVLVAGKNAKGEWGEVNLLKFTTPAEAPSQAPRHTPQRPVTKQ